MSVSNVIILQAYKGRSGVVMDSSDYNNNVLHTY